VIFKLDATSPSSAGSFKRQSQHNNAYHDVFIMYPLPTYICRTFFFKHNLIIPRNASCKSILLCYYSIIDVLTDCIYLKLFNTIIDHCRVLFIIKWRQFRNYIYIYINTICIIYECIVTRIIHAINYNIFMSGYTMARINAIGYLLLLMFHT